MQNMGNWKQTEQQKTTVKLSGSPEDALAALARFPTLAEIIAVDAFKTQASKKYPRGPELADEELIDLYTALLLIKDPIFQQSGKNQATPEGALNTLERFARNNLPSRAQREGLSTKLCNLRSSSLWDTVSELLVADQLIRGCKNSKVVLEHPLSKPSRKMRPKDADVAILDTTGDPFYLIDAVTPQRVSPMESVSEQIAKWIANKYDTKFSDYVTTNPLAKVAIVVSLLKNEEFYAPFLLEKMAGRTAELPSAELQSKPGLQLGLACSFRSLDGTTLQLDPIAKFER